MQLIVAGILAFFCFRSFSYQSIELSIPSKLEEPIGECKLGATLLLPDRPTALIIFVHGSGGLDRNETMPGGNAPFRDIAEYLSQNGIATLRYDKRTFYKECAQNWAKSYRSSPLHFISDIENVIQTSLRRPDLNRLPLYLLGHSQGVNFVLEIAASRRYPIRGTLLLAGLGRYAIDETIIRQLSGLVEADTYPEQTETLKKYLELGRAYFKELRAGKLTEKDIYYGGYRKWWSDWIEITERGAAVAEKSPAPSLLLQGNLDWNITLEDFVALRKATENIQGSESEMFLGLYHSFAREGAVEVDERVLKRITKWVKAFHSG